MKNHFAKLITFLVLFVLSSAAMGQPPGDPPDDPPPPAPQPLPPPQPAPPPPPPPPQPPAQLPELPESEADKAKGKRIADVRIVGNRRISKEQIRGWLKWMRVGKPFNPRGMTRDVRELWDQGFFEDIEVDLTQTQDECRLRILVKERPSVRELQFNGNKDIDDEDLGDIVSEEVKVGEIINHASIRRAIQKIRDKYAEDGFFLAEASYEVQPRKNNEVIVKFTIKEHEKVTVRRVTFIGNHSVDSSELRDLMITGQAGFFSFGSGGPF